MAKTTKKASGKRTLIAPKGDKRYIRRDTKSRIKETDDQGKSLSQDSKKTAKTKVKPGYGDQGDQSRRKAAPKKAIGKSAPVKKSTPKKIAAPRKRDAPKKKVLPKKK